MSKKKSQIDQAIERLEGEIAGASGSHHQAAGATSPNTDAETPHGEADRDRRVSCRPSLLG